MTGDKKQRLDQLLVELGHYPSRARARDAILRRSVVVDGITATKPAQLVAATTAITIGDAARAYVSRAAVKLIHALDHFQLSPKDKNCLDIGASTGGFSQVLLERGCAHVTAIDVGHGQLAGKIARNARVTLHEGLNARDLTSAHLPSAPEAIVCDASFISLKQVLPPALDLAQPGAWLAALIKPQFELGRENIGKGGIIRDPQLYDGLCSDIGNWLEQRGWAVSGTIASPLYGGSGNREFIIAAHKP